MPADTKPASALWCWWHLRCCCEPAKIAGSIDQRLLNADAEVGPVDFALIDRHFGADVIGVGCRQPHDLPLGAFDLVEDFVRRARLRVDAEFAFRGFLFFSRERAKDRAALGWRPGL
jgi:hypothetical protein